MKKRELVFLVGGLIGAVSLFGLMSYAHAAEAPASTREEITISPTTKKYTIEAGESTSGTIKVINTGAVEFDFKVYSRPYSVSGSTYNPDYSDENAPRADAFDWVTFEVTEGTLQPRESQEIKYTVEVPEDASLGGHYAVLFAETQPKENTGEQVVRKKRIGSVLRVNTGGDVNEQGSVTQSSIPWYQSQPPITTTIDVKNDGNVDFTAESTILVSDVFGNVKYSSNKSNVIYPDTTRTIDQNWDGVSWLGLYKVEISTMYLDTEFRDTQYVLVMPRWTIALAVIFIIGGAYAAYIRRH